MPYAICMWSRHLVMKKLVWRRPATEDWVARSEESVRVSTFDARLGQVPLNNAGMAKTLRALNRGQLAMTPWLDKYLAAGSFAVLGESTFAARFPFALLGLLCVISVYPLALALFRDRWIGVLAMAFLALSVPFILHVRQCRYYSPIILCSIWALYFFVGIARGRRLAVAGFVTAMTLLFQSSILNAAATAVALVPCVLVSRFDAAALRRAALAAAVLLVLNAPSVYFFSPSTSEPRL